MKNKLLTGLLICVAHAGFAQWQQQTSPTIANLYDVSFYDQRIGYAVGANGTVLRTKNGGKEWQQMKSPDSSDLLTVTVIDSFTVIVTTAGNDLRAPGIYRTITGGTKWQKVLSDPDPFYATATPKDELFSVSKKIYQSSDTGRTWIPRSKNIDSNHTFTHISFYDKNKGMIGGNVAGPIHYSAEFLRSVNGGQSWWGSDPFSFPNDNGFSAMSELRGDTVLMFTNKFNGYEPSDSSELVLLTKFTLRRVGMDSVWFFKSKVINNRFADRIYDCRFFNSGTGYAAGSKGIYSTSNPSKRWIREYGSRTPIRSIFMVSEKKAFAVGDEGLILHREEPEPPMVAASVSLRNMMVYPNPAAGNTTIRFELDKKAVVTLQVTNEKGIPVYMQAARSMNSGTHSLIINAAQFNKGIHYVTLLIDGQPVAKKELLVIR